MGEIEKIQPQSFYYKDLSQKHFNGEVQSEVAINLKKQKENKANIEEKNKISVEEIMKSLMRPKEIKRLLYLVVPFTRHFINEIDQKKGSIIDKNG